MGVAAALLLPAAGGSADESPLERHRPLLRYDRDERSFAGTVSRFASGARLERDRGGPVRLPDARFLGARYRDGRLASADDRLVPEGRTRLGPPLVYGRSVRDEDARVWLQYWLFLADNPQDRGIARTGRHTGDWELVQIRLDGRGGPAEVVFAQHTWAERCSWGEIEKRGAAPVVYVANGSHALYARAGKHDRPSPDPNDEADGRGRKARPSVQRVTAVSPRWMAWPGRWGESEAGFVPGEQSSPRGPRFQPERWSDPGRFGAEQARSCGSGPPERRWQAALTLAIGAALLGAVLRAAYRRRRSGAD